MTDRRFNEEEVAAIFERASTAQPSEARALPGSEGMTLAEIQEIGREVGIAPELIQRAAMSMDHRGTPTARTLLGLPIGVGQTVDLPRKLSDEEWERLVVDLRETFDARGVMRSEGSFRQWTNGNLQVLLEPTATGQRIRFRTVNGSISGALLIGGSLIFMALLGVLGVYSRRGLDLPTMTALGSVFALGASLIGISAARLPSWARTRRQQMEALAGRLSSAISE